MWIEVRRHEFCPNNTIDFFLTCIASYMKAISSESVEQAHYLDAQ